MGVAGEQIERLPREREVVGSIPDRVIPKTLGGATSAGTGFVLNSCCLNNCYYAEALSSPGK